MKRSMILAVFLVVCVTVPGGCIEAPSDAPRSSTASDSPDVEQEGSLQRAPRPDQPLPDFETVDAEIMYYVDKLPDEDFTSTYGGEEHPRIWYTAAEELGRIGKPAIPYLIERLESADPYEVKLALYALLLASQDSAVVAETKGEYVLLGEVLTESSNDENKTIAQEWWSKHKHLWR